MDQVSQWLIKLGLGVYCDSFRSQQIEFSILPSLTDADLMDLGIAALGHRKQLLAAIALLDQPANRITSRDSTLAFLLHKLPTPIALALTRFQDEDHPVLKLWAACDAIETLLQTIVFLGIGDLSRRGELADPLGAQLGELIETPTLGKWRLMAQLVAEKLSEDSPLSHIRPLIEDTLTPMLHGPGHPRVPEQSFLALRNRLAHGGGMSSILALDLLSLWRLPLEDLWKKLGWLCELDIVVCTEGGLRLLRGPDLQSEPYVPLAPEPVRAAFKNSEAVIAVLDDQVIPLWPFALFGTPRHPDPTFYRQTGSLPQMYVRRGEIQLEYAPLGEDAIPQSVADDATTEHFLSLFQRPYQIQIKEQGKFTVHGFEQTFRQFAKNLYGRQDERETLRRKLAEVTNGILWLEGAAGMGKSYLVADLAHELLSTPSKDTLVLGYRFRANDPRCGRAPFLQFVIERLSAWLPSTNEDMSEHNKPLERLKILLAQLVERRVQILLDGLDEITERDRSFVTDIPLGIQSPTLTWLCAGRPEQGLSAAFADAGAISIFPDGLTPMRASDIRTWLLDRIGPLRKQLLKQDTEQGEQIGNPFVDKVTRLSKGLPLYVHYVIADIQEGRYRVLDAGEALPPGLHEYHEELLRRLSVGTLHQVLTPLAAALAIAREPLSALALADLLHKRGKLVPKGESGAQLVRQGLTALASLLRRAQTPEGDEGYSLYHHSLSQHMIESPHSCDAVAGARDYLADLSEDIPTGPIAPYLFRQGITHLLEIDRVESSLNLLTRFDYLMARLQDLKDPTGVDSIDADWQGVLVQNPEIDRETRLWLAFWHERRHILRRGNEHWPAYKILLQLAVEHADDSPATIQSENWLQRGLCNWFWLRDPQRIAHAVKAPCINVFENNMEVFTSAIELSNGRILSCSSNGTLRIWDRIFGKEHCTLSGHTKHVWGVSELPGGHILSWSDDCTLRLWDSCDGAAIATLEAKSEVYEAKVLSGGRIVSRQHASPLLVWDIQACEVIATLGKGLPYFRSLDLFDYGIIVAKTNSGAQAWFAGDYTELLPPGVESGHIQIVDENLILFQAANHVVALVDPENPVPPIAILSTYPERIKRADALGNGRYLLRSAEESIHLWNSRIDAQPTPIGERKYSEPIEAVLADGKIITWQRHNWSIHVWDDQCGEAIGTLDGHNGDIIGVRDLSDGRIVSWSDDGTLRIWHVSTAALQATLDLRDSEIDGVKILRSGLVLSWDKRGLFWLWDVDSGGPLVPLEGHTREITGVKILSDGNILSWSEDKTLRIWNPNNGQSIENLLCHDDSIKSIIVHENKHVLSWSDDGTMKIWSADDGTLRHSEYAHSARFVRVFELDGERILSYGYHEAVKVWSKSTGALITVFETGLIGVLGGASSLPDGRIISWDNAGEVKIWNGLNGSLLLTLECSGKSAVGAVVLDNDHILSLGASGELMIWNIETGERLLDLKGHSEEVNAMALTDNRILSWAGDGTLRIWDRVSGKLLVLLEGHTRWVEGAKVLDDERILSWSGDGTLRIWDGETGTTLAILEGHKTTIAKTVVIPNELIISWSEDGVLCFWDESSGAHIATHEFPVGEIINTVLLEGGNVLTWSNDRLFRIWRRHNGCTLDSSFPINQILDHHHLSKNIIEVVSHTTSHQSGSLPWTLYRTAGITTPSSGHPSIQWHGDDHMGNIPTLLPSGNLIVCSSRRVISLQAYFGNKRTNLDDIESGCTV